MFRRPVWENAQWNTQWINLQIRDFLPEAQWELVDKSVVNVDDIQPLKSNEEARQYVEKIMKDCKGTLDLLGPPSRLFDDLRRVKFRRLCGIGHYMDSELKTYTAKKDVIHRILANFQKWGTELNDPVIRNVWALSIFRDLDRRLAGSYEIIPSEWCYAIESEVEAIRQLLTDKCSTSNTRAVRPDDLLTLFDAQLDSDDLPSLIFYVSQMYVPMHVLQMFKVAKTKLLKVFDRHPLIFRTFSDCPPKSLNFPLVIRLIRDGDEKFLFAGDVEKAVKWALRRRKVEKVDLKLDNNLPANRHLCISYSEYLNILERNGLEANEITLVDARVWRTRFSAVTMDSPTGSMCIPASDALLLLAGILTYKWQAFPGIDLHQTPDVLRAFVFSAKAVCGGHMVHLFVDVDQVSEISEQFENVVKKYVRSRSLPVQPIEIPEEQFAFISVDRLKEELVKWNMQMCPNVFDIAVDVAAKYNGFTLKCYTRIDLCMALRDCFIYSLSDCPLGTVLHHQGFCTNFSRFPCVCRQREVGVDVSNYPPIDQLTVQKEDEFAMQFHSFDECKEVFGSLLDKKSGQKYVSSRMAFYTILKKLLTYAPSDIRSLLSSGYAKEANAVRTENEFFFYLTIEEINILEDDALRKMKEKNEESSRRNKAPLFSDTERNTASTAEEIAYNIPDCMYYVSEITKSLTTFHEYLPERKVILRLCDMLFEGEPRLGLHTGELMQAVQAMLTHKSEVVSDHQWGIFHQMVYSYQVEGRWICLPPDEVFKPLKQLPIDLSRFHFVPEVDCVFNHFTRKVSAIIKEVLDEEALKREETEVVQTAEKAEHPDAVQDSTSISDDEESANIDEVSIEEPVENLDVSSDSDAVSENDMAEEVYGEWIERRFRKLEEKVEKISVHNEHLTEANGILKQVISKLQKERNDQKSRMTQEIKKKDAKIAELEKKELEGEKKLKKANETAETKKKLAEELKTENSHLLYQYGTLSEVLKTKNEDIEDWKKREKTLSRDVDGLKKREKTTNKVVKEQNEQIRKLKDTQGHQQEILKQKAVRLETCQRENEELRKRVSNLENLLAAQEKTPEVECGICLAELAADPVKCEICTTQWHRECIEQWVAKKATCPVCNRSLPSPTNFPPLN